MLYPLQTSTRLVEELDGLWKFKLGDEDVDPRQPLPDPLDITVPGSFNEQFADKKIRDYLGSFWYEREINLDEEQLAKRNVLYFGAVAQNCEIYVNGHLMGKHTGGYTPFEFEVTNYLHQGKNDIKVHGNNLLDNTTIPTAEQSIVDQHLVQRNRFDFFNFAGINRPVKLYTTDFTYLESLAVNYTVDKDDTVIITPAVKINGDYDLLKFTVFDEAGQMVAQGNQAGKITLKHAHRWQPLNAYLYRLKVEVYRAHQLVDVYFQDFGIRTIVLTANQLLINGRPVYLKGFGWHEDTIAHGGGVNPAQVAQDLNLMKSLGANSFRTSHYPYADETMRLADRLGFLVIDEVPAVGLYDGFNAALTGGKKSQENTWKVLDTADNHRHALAEMIDRDHDHPSVIMWSLANEPASMEKGAHEYFAPLAAEAKRLDPQRRPITIVNIMTANAQNDLVGDLVDVLCLNRYWGWYVDYDDLQRAQVDAAADLEAWHQKFPDKPIIWTEFGADTVAGLHSQTHEPYSEEYQLDYYRANFAVLDRFDYVQGEQVWNFADFATDPSLIRIGSENRKGIFTRARQPKEVVGLLKDRWQKK